nr:hypothetical protein CFP56_53232 [Quercus suber]
MVYKSSCNHHYQHPGRKLESPIHFDSFTQNSTLYAIASAVEKPVPGALYARDVWSTQHYKPRNQLTEFHHDAPQTSLVSEHLLYLHFGRDVSSQVMRIGGMTIDLFGQGPQELPKPLPPTMLCGFLKGKQTCPAMT